MNENDSSNENQNNGAGANITALSIFIIILAFFIFTVAISKPDDTKKESLLATVEKTFGGRTMAERKAAALSSRRKETRNPVDFSPVISGDDDIARYLEIKTEYEYQALALPVDFVFEKSSTAIKADAYAALGKIANLVKSGGYSAEIIGYPEAGIAETAGLSALRAVSLLRYIADTSGINPERLGAYSWTGQKNTESSKTDISGKTGAYMEIVFYSGDSIEEDESFSFKDFIFRVLD